MLKGKVCFVKNLVQDEIEAMFELMNGYYENMEYNNFILDLQNKENLILLKDENNLVKGFSTIVFYDLEIKNKTYKILFSGDTIIHQDYWAHNDLANVWLQYAIKKQQEFKQPLYWLLISKGYKTYKYLTTFFKEYYPNQNKTTPELEQSILDKFGETFYPDKYDKMQGILKMEGCKDFLKEEYAKIPDEKMKDKVVKYFLEKNPYYYKGNELVCITDLSMENVNNAGKRLLGLR